MSVFYLVSGFFLSFAREIVLSTLPIHFIKILLTYKQTLCVVSVYYCFVLTTVVCVTGLAITDLILQQQYTYEYVVEVWNMLSAPEPSPLEKALYELQTKREWKPGCVFEVPEIVDLPVEGETGEKKVADGPIPDASARRRGHIRLYMAGFLIMSYATIVAILKALN